MHQAADAAADYAMACAYAIALAHVYEALGEPHVAEQLRELQGSYARQSAAACREARCQTTALREAQRKEAAR